MGRVAGKVALVTGAAQGIGRACAERLAAEGAVVVLTDIGDGEEAVAGIRGASGQAEFLRHDVTSEEAWAEVVGAVGERHGRLDLLVNNAGIAIAGSVLDTSLVDWRRQMAVNVEGVFLGVKHAIPLMQAGGGGSIVNMSSVAGLKASPTLAGYSASKGAVRMFTKSVALECANRKFNIRVNSVHPGIIQTAIWDTGLGLSPPGSNEPPDLDAYCSTRVPLGVTGQPEDIANGVLWLCSDESRYITGMELIIDGGLTLR
jgi:NAD(P)-dependent dehydrogenase (short-subunit alcohol dehydrogenase family)